MIQNGVQPFDQYQLHLKVVGGVCYALVIHSGVNVPYLEERGYHFERREYRFNFRHVPDSMRDQVFEEFPARRQEGLLPFWKGENCANRAVSSFFQITLQIFFRKLSSDPRFLAWRRR